MKSIIQTESAIEHFNLLCVLDEAEHKYNKRKSENSCQSELEDSYKQLKQIRRKVINHANKMENIKTKRQRSESAKTIILKTYLKAHNNCGSVTRSTNGIPSFFDWAERNIDIVYVNAEITNVERFESISFSLNGKKAKPVKTSSLVVAMSQIRNSIEAI